MMRKHQRELALAYTEFIDNRYACQRRKKTVLQDIFEVSNYSSYLNEQPNCRKTIRAFQQYMVKRISAQGGCLGDKRR